MTPHYLPNLRVWLIELPDGSCVRHADKEEALRLAREAVEEGKEGA